MMKPAWLRKTETYIGLKEVPGSENNPTIVNWLAGLNAWWRDDLTPWCGTIMGHVFQDVQLQIPKAWYRAKAWLDWGDVLKSPAYGCIVVFTRTGGGHVGLVVGEDQKGRLMVLGGNQSDTVSIAAFDRSRVSGYRWPKDSKQKPVYQLPKYKSNGELSKNEA